MIAMPWLVMATLVCWTLAASPARAQQASPAAQPSNRSTDTVLAPRGDREAVQWERLRRVQASIPTDATRGVPFASVELGRGPRAVVIQDNNIGGSFRLSRILYTLDGHELVTETRAPALDRSHRTVFEGRMFPGRHKLRVAALVGGYGYGIFSYMKAYRVRLSAAKSFDVHAGSTARVRVLLKEDTSAPMRQRFSLSFKVNSVPARRGPRTAIATAF